jgi:hypothetical protein
VSWNCAFCSTRNELRELSEPDGVQLFPELTGDYCEFIDPRTQPAPMLAHDGSLATTLSDVQPVVFVVDGTFDRPAMQRLADYIESCFGLFAATTPVALIVFSNIVSVYDMTATDMAAAHALPAGETALLSDHVDASACERCVAPFGTAGGALRNALRALVDAALPADVAHALGDARQRAMGAAVDVALQLLDVTRARTVAHTGAPSVSPPVSAVALGAHVLLVTSGATNYGPGAVPTSVLSSDALGSASSGSGRSGTRTRAPAPADAAAAAAATLFFSDVGRRAAERRVLVSALACGARLLGVPLLLCMSMPTGGHTVLHRDVDDQCAGNVRALLVARQQCGASGALTLRCNTHQLSVSRVIGAATNADADECDVGDANDSFVLCRCRVLASARTSTLAVYLECERAVSCASVLLQCVATLHDASNVRRVRVRTIAVPVTRDVGAWCASANLAVVALLLARREVLLVRKAEQRAGVRALESTLRRIVLRCGTRQGAEYVVPPSLQPLMSVAFALCSGALLGALRQHIDDLDHERGRLLAASPSVAAPLIDPALYVVSDAGELRRVACADVALWATRVLLFDAGTALLVWCGAASGGAASAAAVSALQCARALAARRTPLPYVAVFEEGDSLARLLLSRLYPLHKDAESDQLRVCPDLPQLSPDERAALNVKLLPSDSETLPHFERRMTALGAS